nr:type II toxin-antitoxin system RelE/ParE family toxin [Paludisphaera mucosa]
MPVVLTPEAELDFLTAADWYQDRADLGTRFTAAIHQAPGQIEATPELHRVVHRDVRRARVATFPYLVYYRVRAERIEVLAILHGRRSASAWKDRL